MVDLAPLRAPSSPQVLGENRTSVGGRDLQFSVYDTYRPAKSVSLHALNLLYCGMISGHKRIHTRGGDSFDFVPGESLIVREGKSIHIDVPEAATGAPTTCITLEIERDKIQQIVDRVDEPASRSAASGPWTLRHEYIHFVHTPAIEQILRALVTLFTEDHSYRDVLIDLNATKLVVRLLQTEAQALLLAPRTERSGSHRLSAAIEYVHDHLDRHLTMDELARVACMGRSTFYRYFRNEFGLTPLQYVNRQRMKRAQRLLRDRGQTVTDVSYELGFSSVSHFITTFKKHVGVTPKRYQAANARIE